MKTNKFTLKALDHLGTSDGKKLFNEKHFAESAPRYDLATRLLSLFRDSAWKKQLIQDLPPMEMPVCVDVACGTGDVTCLLADRYPDGTILGIDLTREMINLAEARRVHSHVRFACGDMGSLPMNSGSVDLITGSYAIRNAPDLQLALAEFHRVLKPGGTLAILDFCKPKSAVLQKLQFHLLHFWGGLWGLVLHGNPEVHGYISKSLQTFPDEGALEEIFQQSGFSMVTRRTPFFGMMLSAVLRKND